MNETTPNPTPHYVMSNQPITRVEFAQAEPGYPWYPVHAWLHRSGLYPLLTPGARSLLDVMLWQAWEQEKAENSAGGLVIASIEQFAAWCGDTTRTTYRAVGFLLEPPDSVLVITGNPARLLAKRGPTVWEPLPGRSIARRKGGKPEPPPIDTGLTRLSQNCHETSAPSRDRARPSHPKEREIKTENQNQMRGGAQLPVSAIHSRGFGMGWPEWTLFGQRAIAAGDVRGMLADMGLGDPLLSATTALPALSCEEIQRVASDVGADRSIVNPRRRPVAVAWRLHRARGMAMPQSNAGGKAKGVGQVLGNPATNPESVRASVDALGVAASLEQLRKLRRVGS